MKTNVEIDRLSRLPDDLIHKILSFIGIKCAIRTSFLSSRWRFVWTSLPYLNFSSEDFRTLPKFSKFVTDVLFHRSNQIEVSSVELCFRGKVSQVFVDRILNYAFSHNVQQLIVRCLKGYKKKNQALVTSLKGYKEKSFFPLSLFTSRSLKHLSLINSLVAYSITPTSIWDHSALTTLHVSHVNWWDGDCNKCLDLFSMCTNLKNLTFKQLSVEGTGVFIICHPRLSNLTLECIRGYEKVLDVVAPQLDNLTIKDCSMKCRISASKLSSFHYEGNRPQQIFTDGFHSLEKVNLCCSFLCKEVAPSLAGLLQQVHSTKFLRLNSEIVELLSSSVELLSHQPSPFTNLKSLKIYPLLLNEELDKKVTMSTEVRNYLLDNSPGATITMVSRKEIRDVKNIKQAQKLMEEVQVLVEQGKANSETSRAHMEQGNAPIEMQVQHEQGRTHSTTKMQVELRGMMAQMKSYWGDLRVQSEKGETETCAIISKLLEIKGLLTKLPACQRAEMQSRFSRMCAEAHTVLNDIIDWNKIHCDKKRRRLNAYFCELAPTSQPSS